MLVVLPLQDYFAMYSDLRVENPASEKINEPSNPKHYWRYRIHVSLEDLLLNAHFVQDMARLLQDSGR